MFFVQPFPYHYQYWWHWVIFRNSACLFVCSGLWVNGLTLGSIDGSVDFETVFILFSARTHNHECWFWQQLIRFFNPDQSLRMLILKNSILIFNVYQSIEAMIFKQLSYRYQSLDALLWWFRKPISKQNGLVWAYYFLYAYKIVLIYKMINEFNCHILNSVLRDLKENGLI